MKRLSLLLVMVGLLVGCGAKTNALDFDYNGIGSVRISHYGEFVGEYDAEIEDHVFGDDPVLATLTSEARIGALVDFFKSAQETETNAFEADHSISVSFSNQATTEQFIVLFDEALESVKIVKIDMDSQTNTTYNADSKLLSKVLEFVNLEY